MRKQSADARIGRRSRASTRDDLIDAIGAEIVHFQEETTAFDDVAAQVLALDRRDLACMTMLLFGGPLSMRQLTAALQTPRNTVAATVGRLQLAGYARRRPETAESRVELTEHARRWIERIWEPLRVEGRRLLSSYSAEQLAIMSGFLGRARAVQARQARRLRKWLAVPSSGARRAHLRGGLSPVALRRVQLFVEANLERRIHLKELAERAGLSLHHFARAFRATAGMTPRAFVEHRRIARATQLIDESRQSLADIALESGFGTQSRLTTAFRRRTGFTPGEYRRREAKGQPRSHHFDRLRSARRG